MKLAVLLMAVASAFAQQAASPYALGPDSQRNANVPKGAVTQHAWNNSKIYPGTTRDYWIYVPAQYNAARPAPVMIFQDGSGFLPDDGAWRVPIVFDNLIARGEMRPTIGIFINPGVLPARAQNEQARFNRSFEYDALGDRYARFLIEEILPEVSKTYRLSNDPNDRAIAGSSSGGIAAFVAAWERPDTFRRVLSFIGSYTNLRGGDGLIDLVRKVEPKPLRVFLQDGDNDLNIYSGSWWMANQALAKSLEYAGYDSRFVTGTEAHNTRHGGAILPDALRWLWREYPKPIVASKGVQGHERHFITEFLDPAGDWELVKEGYQSTSAPTVDLDGDIYFADAAASRILKIERDGSVATFQENTGGAAAIVFAGDHHVYAAQPGKRRIAAYSMAGEGGARSEEVEVVAGMDAADLAVTSKGNMYITDPAGKRIWFAEPGGRVRTVYEAATAAGEGVLNPTGVRLSPDEHLLLISDRDSRWVWSFQIQPDGGLQNAEAFYHLESGDESTATRASAMTLDESGHLYVATNLGIQICDQPGRVVGIIRPPSNAPTTGLVFGGPKLDYLYATAGGKLYRRHLRRKGVFPWAPVRLPRPQL
ncbi:MAG: SMP-30/gluconolactonase/LRE family protein [Acidobacteriota bacterium]